MTHPTFKPGGSGDPSVQAVAEKAVDLIPDGARVGLGSGRAASAFIAKLGARHREGLRVSGVPTSRASADAARQAGIPLIELGDGGLLDLTVDGADEVTPALDLVKGRGGALVRERIVAAASACQVILVGEDKLVRGIGERGPVPVEVIPIAEWLVMRDMNALGLVPARRMDASGLQPFVSDNGNIIIDCALRDPISDVSAVRALERALRSVVGVVDTGLFLGTADRVLVGYPDGRVDVRFRTGLAVSGQ
jgi:ribose 5-phosphate isomerase A